MDARSLLRAKKAEARIDHTYAAYSARGELRCSICAIPDMSNSPSLSESVKQWDAHLLTKQHRTSVAREKAEQAQRAAKSAPAPAQTKRPAVDDEESGAGPSSKRTKGGAGPAGLPEGFFSKGNAPVEEDEEEEEEVQPEEGSRDVIGQAGQTDGPAPPEPTGDNELDDFLASLTNSSLTDTADAPVPASSTEYTVKSTQATRKHVPKYKEIEPGQASYEAAPVRNVPAEEQEKEEEVPQETEAERRARVAREEREEIVRRLEEEERAQEDADSRVASLKERMALLRKRREAKTGGKQKTVNGVNGA